MNGRNLYEVLGVDPRATQEEIKQAYRRLARETHPDVRRDDPHATERFKEINEAYAVLSDPAKRTQYDRYGEVGRAPGPFGETLDPFGDLVDFFFGGRRTVERTDHDAPERGADLRYDLEVTLEEVAAGVERRLTVRRLETCPVCFGTGAERGSRPERCPTCQGSGQVRHVQRTVLGHLTQIVTCRECHGTGTHIARPCKSCRGAGQAEAEREVTVTIPAGVEDEMHLRLPGEGEAGSRGGERGDLYVVVHVAPHEVFTRRGRDLRCDLEVTMTQAALGDEVAVTTLDGDATLSVPAGTQPGTVLTLRNRGLPDLRGGRGHLHVTVQVAIPRQLIAEQKALLAEFARLQGEKRGGRRRPILRKVKDLLQ
jgi:molecular chaperone DnaJ